MNPFDTDYPEMGERGSEVHASGAAGAVAVVVPAGRGHVGHADRLLGGVACYIAVMVLFVAAFKKGGSLTVLYPVYASTFIWAALIAWRVYDTPIRAVNVAGMVLLVLGMYLMGKS